MNKTIQDWAQETDRRATRAVELFREGYNCAQAVALALCDLYDLPEPLTARISASFGAGIGRMRETCGTANAIFMMAGMEVGDAADSTQAPHDACPYPDAQVKKKNYEVVQRLAADYRREAGSIICRELLGLVKAAPDGSVPPVPISATPEPRTPEYYKRRPCTAKVELAVRIYMNYLREKYTENGK